MSGHEKQPTRPTADCLSVPIFDQKRRNRVPVTSNPCEQQFCLVPESMPSSSSSWSTPGTSVGYQALCYPTTATQGFQWNRQGTPQAPQQSQHGGGKMPAPTLRNTSQLPYKVVSRSCLVTSKEVQRTQSKPVPHTGFSQKAPQPSYTKTNPPNNHFAQTSRPPPPPLSPPRSSMPAAHAQRVPKRSPDGRKISMHHTQTAPQTGTQTLPSVGRSLRIVTAVIEGMRHWSQFKDRAPFLFEIFATLDSAVTFGAHGAKNFLLRDGKDAVQCLFYENEQFLPRLFRGQVYRCVGNYDRTRDVLVCMSVRAAKLSEQRNAQLAVEVCDLEMRELVKSFNEM